MICLVEPLALENDPRSAYYLLQFSLAIRANSQSLFTKALLYLQDLLAFLALIFVDRHYIQNLKKTEQRRRWLWELALGLG